MVYGWCHAKLPAVSARTSSQCHFIRSHIRRVRVCLAVTCHLHFGQTTGSFTCYCGNKKVDWIPKLESVHKYEYLSTNQLILQICPWSYTQQHSIHQTKIQITVAEKKALKYNTKLLLSKTSQHTNSNNEVKYDKCKSEFSGGRGAEKREDR